MVKAIVSIEDYRFYEHGALDLRGTLRALVTNQAQGGVVQGGSSITQQMVKLTLVAQADSKAERVAATDDTLARKVRELRYAIAFEEQYSKDWILERYLNIAYFGDGAYGIQSAARHYFDKNAKDLDLRESAMLAGLVKNPTGLDPTNSPDAARERRNVVLDRMAQLDVITPKQAAKTKKADLGLDAQPSDNGCVNSRAPFFCDYVINTLMQDPSLGETKEERKQLLRSGGLTIRTTIDLRFQAAADRAVQEYTDPTDQVIGGVAMVEPGTGEVKAIAQSRPMGSDRDAGQTYLNYVVPQEVGDAAGFQAGSTFKAFVLAQALMRGVQPSTTISVPAQEFIPERNFEDCDGPYGGPYNTVIWDPANFDATGGTYNLYTGTQNSVNTFFANLEQLTGICKPYELARNMGVDLTDPDNERVPSFTLGVADVSPLEMAEAYATFAARGQHCDSRPGHLDRGRQRQPAQGVRPVLHPGADQRRRRHRQRHPQGRAGARRLRAVHHHQPGGRRQDRHHAERPRRLVQRLHAQPVDRDDARRGQLVRPADRPRGPDRRRPLHRQRLGLRPRRTDLGPGDGRGGAVAPRRDLHPARPERARRRGDHGPERRRPAARQRPPDPRGRRLQRARRARGLLRVPRGHGRLLRPRLRARSRRRAP